MISPNIILQQFHNLDTTPAIEFLEAIDLFENLRQAESGQIKTTVTGRLIDWYVNNQMDGCKWREEVIQAEIVCLSRPLTVFIAPRKINLLTYDSQAD